MNFFKTPLNSIRRVINIFIVPVYYADIAITMDKTVLSLLILAFHCLKADQGREEHHELFASPLFGSLGGGDPFDDGITALVPHTV